MLEVTRKFSIKLFILEVGEGKPWELLAKMLWLLNFLFQMQLVEQFWKHHLSKRHKFKCSLGAMQRYNRCICFAIFLAVCIIYPIQLYSYLYFVQILWKSDENWPLAPIKRMLVEEVDFKEVVSQSQSTFNSVPVPQQKLNQCKSSRKSLKDHSRPSQRL